MVLKPAPHWSACCTQFENDVEMYGAQTKDTPTMIAMMFENDVEMYGVQTDSSICCEVVTFENDVEMYGAQTF